MTFSEVVERAIGLATAITTYRDTELPKRHPQYPLVDPSVPDPPPPPQEEELRQFLRSRPPDEVYRLLALTYLGRGDFNPADIPGATVELHKSFPTVDTAVDQLLSKPLDEFLATGLDEFRRAGLDLDRLVPAA
jgi:hypothetical protein